MITIIGNGKMALSIAKGLNDVEVVGRDENKLKPAYYIIDFLKKEILKAINEVLSEIDPFNKNTLKTELLLKPFIIEKYSLSIIADNIIFNIDFYRKKIKD